MRPETRELLRDYLPHRGRFIDTQKERPDLAATEKTFQAMIDAMQTKYAFRSPVELGLFESSTFNAFADRAKNGSIAESVGENVFVRAERRSQPRPLASDAHHRFG